MQSKRWTSLIVSLAAVTGSLVLVTSSNNASARDNGGVQQFMSEQFGGSPQSEPPAPSFDRDVEPEDRPLVVRPHHHRSEVAKVMTGPTGPVSIYEDRTLRRGDAVMTAKGIRIFRGSGTMPYQDADFVAVADSTGLSRTVEKALLAIDHVPRS